MKKEKVEISCNEEINVKDIRNDILYTQDNKIIMYINISPLNYELLSNKELKRLKDLLASEMSGVNVKLKFFSIARPSDIDDLVENLTNIQNETISRVRKQLLKKMISYSKLLVLKGEAVERQCFLMIWKDYEEYAKKELKKLAVELSSRLSNCGVNNKIQNEQEIIQLINAFTNMSMSGREDADYEDYMPSIE